MPLVARLEKQAAGSACPAPRCSSPAIPTSAPTALMHSLKHYKVLHEKNVILTIETAPAPRVDPAERVRMEPIGETFSRVTLRFGFMEIAQRAQGAGHRPQARLAVRHHVDVVLPVAARRSSRRRIPAMPRWQDRLFIAARRAAPTTPPTTSRSRPSAWSRSGPKSQSAPAGAAAGLCVGTAVEYRLRRAVRGVRAGGE